MGMRRLFIRLARSPLAASKTTGRFKLPPRRWFYYRYSWPNAYGVQVLGVLIHIHRKDCPYHTTEQGIVIDTMNKHDI